jgi:polyvinyl alcohol dehydrogenase (cytochrome)
MQYHDGKLFVPVSSKEVLATVVIPGACCTSHGMLVALDAGTGNVLWRYHTTGEAVETVLPGERVGPNGAPVWATPTLDSKRNALYIGTGQNYTEPATRTSDAIISLDMDSGAVNWVFQAREADTWNGNCGDAESLRCPYPAGHDFDFGAAPILLQDGDTLIAGDKGGVVYSLQAGSGALNWSNKVSLGSTLGGIHWGMAVDRQRVYVAATDFNIDKASGGVADLVPGARPGIYALDLNTGAIDWEIHPVHVFNGVTTPSLYSASLSVSNDLLFAGSLDGIVRAFHTADGSERWSLATAVDFTDINGVSGNGGTIDSVGVVVAGDGLLVNSGYVTFQGVDGRYQAGPGSALFVLALPP